MDGDKNHSEEWLSWSEISFLIHLQRFSSKDSNIWTVKEHMITEVDTNPGLVGAFSVITNLRMELFEALYTIHTGFLLVQLSKIDSFVI